MGVWQGAGVNDERTPHRYSFDQEPTPEFRADGIDPLGRQLPLRLVCLARLEQIVDLSDARRIVLDANGPSTGVLINRNDLHGLPVGISNNGTSN